MPTGLKDSSYVVAGSAAEHRLRVQHAAEERAALRTIELAAQSSPTNDVEERIRIWERLHALSLPRASGHVLVTLIATQTRLTVGQVHEEQRRRAAMIARPREWSPESGAASQSEPAPVESAAAPRHDG